MTKKELRKFYRGKRTALTTAEQSRLEAVLTGAETTFKQNSFGVYEPDDGEIAVPASFDIIFDPLLCFDRRGYRVGRRNPG